MPKKMPQYVTKVPGGYNIVARKPLTGYGDPIEVGKVYVEVRSLKDSTALYSDNVRELVVDIDYSDDIPEITTIQLGGSCDSDGKEASMTMEGENAYPAGVPVRPWRRTFRLSKNQKH